MSNNVIHIDDGSDLHDLVQRFARVRSQLDERIDFSRLNELEAGLTTIAEMLPVYAAFVRLLEALADIDNSSVGPEI